jgi:hypothetical protein
MLVRATESIQPGFGKTPEALNAIDMGSAADEFIQVMDKQPDNMPKLGLTDSCADCIPVFHFYYSGLASLH